MDDLLGHYNSELNALRRLTASFVRAHPEAARRLRLGEGVVEDPHVSRLLEGVALLNARVHQKIDDEFPELTDGILDQLYPHYLAPIPSMAIVELGCKKDLATSALVPAGTQIETEPVNGENCCFSTGGEARLWPIAIEDAALVGRPFLTPGSRQAPSAAAVLRLTVRCQANGQTFAKLGVDRLRFFLRGQTASRYALYEIIHSSAVAVAVADRADDPNPLMLGPEAVAPVGFENNEALLPSPARSAPGYRLLTEFFAFAEKFLFFELSGLEAKTARSGGELHLFIYLDRTRADLEKIVRADGFALNCVPVVNLFRQPAEPIRLTRTQSEYQVIPDVRRVDTLEVHSINEVAAASSDGERVVYRPFYATQHASASADDNHFWYAARRPTQGSGSGLDCFVRLVDLDLNPNLPANWVLSVQTTCTNGNLPSRLPFGGGHPHLRLMKPIATVTSVTAVTAPSPSLRLPNRAQGWWRLVSHLLLNHLSITGGERGANALRELLMLYDFRDSRDTRALIDSLVSIDSKQRTARVSGQRGALCRGIEIELLLDDRVAAESGIFLLTAVLERVFALQANVNSFTQLSVALRGKPGFLHRWPPRAGHRPLL
ncbi:MAG TPA: type VI secretion system baseplate subunit TssF [Steroidobacteraceae bacterium]|jgi:type VI secretion system protein ImpG